MNFSFDLKPYEFGQEKILVGVDMGLTESDAALVVDELAESKASTGKPAFFRGIPYDFTLDAASAT